VVRLDHFFDRSTPKTIQSKNDVFTRAHFNQKNVYLFYLQLRSSIEEKKSLSWQEVGCLKVTYRNETEPPFLGVWKRGEGEKELKDLYDYGARFYDPALGRWISVDPLSDEYYSWSPYNYTMDNPVKYIDPNGEFVGTLIGGIIGGIAGGIKAAVNNENVLAGIGEGATAGAIAGAVVDVTVATGGTGLVLIGAAAAGGGLGAVVGDVVGQGIEGFTDKGQSLSEAASLDNKDYSNTLDKALTGAAFGAVGGAAGVAVGKVAQAAQSSTAAVQSTMSKNITTTATTLNKMGASAATTQKAVNKITEGMGTAGKNTANNIAKGTAAATAATETTTQATSGGYQIEHKKITYPTGILGKEN